MTNIPDFQRAYVLTKEGKLVQKKIKVPKDIPAKHLLMKIMGASVCGTDLVIMKGMKDPWTVKMYFLRWLKDMI